MNQFAIVILLSLSAALASEVPSTPPNPCYEGCTPYQENLVKDFMTVGTLPESTPAVYSGVCHHLGMYNPDIEHHAVVLLDEKQSARNFSTIFAFFEGYNAYEDWTVTVARKEMSPYWNTHGSMTVAENTARVIVPDDEGNPVYVYWMRQNPKTKELLYITYMGTANKAFCRLKKHAR